MRTRGDMDSPRYPSRRKPSRRRGYPGPWRVRVATWTHTVPERSGAPSASVAPARDGGCKCLRCLCQSGPRLSEGPVEPARQNGEVRCLDGATGPDAQMRRRIAMTGDVVGGILLVENRLDPLHERALVVDGELGNGRI